MGVGEEAAVAGQGCVGGLGCDFTYGGVREPGGRGGGKGCGKRRRGTGCGKRRGGTGRVIVYTHLSPYPNPS